LAEFALRLRVCLSVALALGLSGNALAEPRLDYCAGATAGARSEAERIEFLRRATEDSSETLDDAFRLFERTGPIVGSSAKPFPLDQSEGKKLQREFFSLTVYHWLSVKSALCACLPESERHAGVCASLPEETAHSCGLEPPSRGVNVRCLTKGR
jgi:hypothetical protein